MDKIQRRSLNQQNGVPATVAADKRSGLPKLLLYTASYALGLYPTEHGGGYSIGHIDPLRLSDHSNLSRGALLLKPHSWYLCPEIRSIPNGSNNYWMHITSAWQHLEYTRQQQRGAQEFSAAQHLAHENYLNTVSTLIEMAWRIGQDKNKQQAQIHYSKITSTGKEQIAFQDIYEFHLLERPQVNEREQLRLQGQPDLIGRVFSLDGKKMTVKFNRPLDRQLLPPQGSFERTVSDTAFKMQQEAVETLRAGEAKNASLLPILVEHRYQHYIPEPIFPRELLNTQQLAAFRGALAVPDMLLVLGPPGTGKTRTITEIVLACAAKEEQLKSPDFLSPVVDSSRGKMIRYGQISMCPHKGGTNGNTHK